MVSIGLRGSALHGWGDAFAPFHLPLLVTALLGAAALCGVAVSTLSFTGVPILLLYAAAMFAGGVVWRRFGSSVVDAGGGWRGEAFRRAGEAAGFGALVMMSALAFGMLSYLAARMNLPYQDAAFTRVDASLGFYWNDWVRFVVARPLLHHLLAAAYRSFGMQIALIVPVLAVLRDRRRSLELYCVFAVVGVVTCLVSGVLPAVGAGPYLAGVPEPWSYDLITVHQPGAATFAIGQLNGIVSMPSFHAAVAVMLAWATRRTGVFGGAVTALNAVMVVSVLSEGKHYLTDAIAGVIVAGATIALVHRALYAAPRPF